MLDDTDGAGDDEGGGGVALPETKLGVDSLPTLISLLGRAETDDAGDDTGDDDSELVALQRIWPDVKIKVNNPRKILKQLDLMGINEKFIYGDVDSIARYITNKYKDSIL